MAIRQFTDVIRDMRFGEMLDELDCDLNQLVTAVESTGKSGTLTITMTLKPSSSGAIEVTDAVKVKLPKLAKGSSLFFATPEGNLVRNNPRQDELPGLKEVKNNTKPMKEINCG